MGNAPERDEKRRGPRTLVYISDGTLSSLAEGRESNAGLLWKLLREVGRNSTQMGDYDPGVQGRGFRRWLNAATGQGITDSVRSGYAFIASRYRPGDRIMLFGYSRGAYAMRSLAGLIDQVGLLQAEHATERRIARAFRFYEAGLDSEAQRAFAVRFCHEETLIDFLGVWDTVKALGLPYPILSRLAPMATEFHNHHLGPHILRAAQALALDEDRTAFKPVLWRLKPGWEGQLEQCWFPGAHADVGGQIDSLPAARALSNLSLVWMLERAEQAGLVLPDGWRARFPGDPAAPAVGPRRGIGRFFVLRRPRRVGTALNESLHAGVGARMTTLPGYRPRAAVPPEMLQWPD